MNIHSKNTALDLISEVTEKVTAQAAAKLFSSNDVNMIVDQIQADLDFYVKSDPAAKNSPGLVNSTYLSFKAVAAYRVAHHIMKRGEELGEEAFRIYARQMSEQMKVLSGVEIHPAAKIKAPFMIDHGWGVVIGETTEIGERCCLLNGVVLGARGIIGNPHAKRHPTLGDDVQIGGMTEILGDIIIGSNTVIGPRLKITRSVPANSVLVRKTEYWTIRTIRQNIFTL